MLLTACVVLCSVFVSRAKYVGVECLGSACTTPPCGMGTTHCECRNNPPMMDIIIAVEKSAEPNTFSGWIQNVNFATAAPPNALVTVIGFNSTYRILQAERLPIATAVQRQALSNEVFTAAHQVVPLPDPATGLRDVMRFITTLTTNTTAGWGVRPVSVFVFSRMDEIRLFIENRALNFGLCKTTGDQHMGEILKQNHVFVHFAVYNPNFVVQGNKLLGTQAQIPIKPFNGRDIVSCFVHDPTTDIIRANTSADLILLPELRAMLCPRTPFVTVSEVQVLETQTHNSIFAPAPPAPITFAPYIEIFNYGPAIVASEIKFGATGLITGDLSGATVMIPHMGMAVIHGTGTLPDCRNQGLFGACTCANGGTVMTYGSYQLCDDAVYIGCGVAQLDANAIFDSSLACTFTATTAGWSIEIGSASAPAFVATDSLTHQSVGVGGIDYWPSLVAAPGNATYPLTFTKSSVGFLSAYGANWALTCPTAGARDRSQCPGCAEWMHCAGAGSLCDTGTGSPEGTCACGVDYYAVGAQSGFFSLSTCNKIPLPHSCYQFQGNVTGELTVSWTNPEFDGGYDNRVTYPVPGFPPATTFVMVPYAFVTGTVGITTLEAATLAASSTRSLPLNCTDAYTPGPSTAPTATPTWTVPTVPSCSAEIFRDGSNSVTVILNFTTADGQGFSPTDPIRYATRFGVTDRNPFLCCNKTFPLVTENTLLANLPIEMWTCPPRIYVSTDFQCDGTMGSVSAWKKALAPKTTCKLVTQVPTNAPTTSPSSVPSVAPSGSPTRAPTLSPTFEPFTIRRCDVLFLENLRVAVNISLPVVNAQTFQNISILEYELLYNETSPTTAALLPTLAPPVFVTINSQGLGQISSSIGASFNLSTQFQLIWIRAVTPSGYMPPVIGRLKLCTIRSSAPTSAPSAAPSDSPTTVPSAVPTGAPTRSPSLTPTQSPTYTALQVQDCTATVTSLGGLDNEVVVSLTPPATFPNLTAGTTINYRLVYYGSNFSQPDTLPITRNKTVGQKFGSVNSARYFDPAMNTSRVTVQIVFQYNGTSNDRQPANPEIQCNSTTSAPTTAPSLTPSTTPTMSPTFGKAYVYLELNKCPNRCECCHALSRGDPQCTGDAPPQRLVAEGGNAIPVSINRLLSVYPHNITVHWRIRMVNRSTAAFLNLTGAIFREDALCGTNTAATQTANPSQAPTRTTEPPEMNPFTTTAAPATANPSGTPTHVPTLAPTVTKIDNDTVNATAQSFGLPPDQYFEWLAASGYDCSQNPSDLLGAPFIEGLRREAPIYWPLLTNSTTKPDFQNTIALEQLVFPGPTLCDISTPWSGSVVLTPNSASKTIGMQVVKENRVTFVQDDRSREAFLVELTGCSVQLAPGRPQDSTACELIYPKNAFLVVINDEKKVTDTTVIVPNESFLRWLPWVLAGIALFLCLLCYLLYRLYVNYRLAKSQKEIKEQERDEALMEREQGFGSGLGNDQIQVNPLATGIPQFAKQTNDDWAKTELAGQQNNVERAEVRVDRFNMRQEFGPTQKTAGGADVGYSSTHLV